MVFVTLLDLLEDPKDRILFVTQLLVLYCTDLTPTRAVVERHHARCQPSLGVFTAVCHSTAP